jgi:hypothetical protein
MDVRDAVLEIEIVPAERLELGRAQHQVGRD